MAENAQKVPEISHACAQRAGMQRSAFRPPAAEACPAASDGWPAAYLCPPQSARPRATMPHSERTAAVEALRHGKVMQRRLHTALTLAVGAT